MIRALIVLTHLFGFLGTISALLLGVSFTKGQLGKYAMLRKLEGKQLHLFLAIIVFWAIAYGANVGKEILSVKPLMETVQGPRGGLAQKATITGFKRELEEATAEEATEPVSEAEDYFSAAERYFAARRYRDAASKYQKSVDVLPTMSGYLNLGFSLFMSDSLQAEDAFIPGIQIARKKGDIKFEGDFLTNIGLVYADQGKLEEALKFHQAALELHKRIDNPLGQASALGNIGLVYADQRKLGEALKFHQAALEIFKQIGDPLGQANALGNIGNAYRNQGKLKESLKFYQAAFEIFKIKVTSRKPSDQGETSKTLYWPDTVNVRMLTMSKPINWAIWVQVIAAVILAAGAIIAAWVAKKPVQSSISAEAAGKILSPKPGKETLSTESPMEWTQGPGAELVQKATITGFKRELRQEPTGFKRELKEAAAELVHEAEDYFNASERDFAAWRYRDAAANYQKSIDILPTMSGYLNLGISLYYICDFRQAEETLVAGIQIARKKRNRASEGAFLGNIALVYADQGKLKESLKFHQEALEIFKQIGNPLYQANVLTHIGNAYSMRGKLEKALKAHQEAFVIFKKISNFLGQGSTFTNIGIVYLQQEDPREALKFHQEALEIFKQIGHPQGQAHALGNIGLVYAKQGELGEALKSFREALKLHREIGHPLGQAHDLTNIGNVYFIQRELEEALKFHQATLDLYRQIGHPLGQANALGNIGSVYAEQGNQEKALELLKQARALYLKMGARTVELQRVEEMIERLNTTMDKPR